VSSTKPTAPHNDQQRFVLWLVLTTLGLGLGLLLTTWVSWRQSASIETTARLQTDSSSSLAFNLEREFLRFRQALERAQQNGHPEDWADTQLRFELLASRVLLMRQNPSTVNLQTHPQYRVVLPWLGQLLEEVEPLLQAPPQHREALSRWAAQMQRMAPEIQNLTNQITSQNNHQAERQVSVVQQQHRLIVGLVLAQALVLVVAVAALWSRQRRLQRERQALEGLNAELVVAKEQADRAHRAGRQFLANMSHELRTPFNGLLGMMDVLEDSPLDPQQHELLQTARRSAQHLMRLLNDLLDLSALDSGQMRIRPEPVDLPGLLRSACQWMQAQAQKQGLEWVLQFDPPAVGLVQADPTRVRQIVLNLLNNALKFTAQGRIVVRLTGVAHGDHVAWTLQVQDSGIGMDATALAQLFQRFQQAENTATRRFGGSGLGLEISRSLARLMGGDITAHSQVGSGSTFTLTLPTPLVKEHPGEERAVASTARHSDPLPAPRWRVLVAEDHPVNRQLLALLLGKLGHQAEFAEDGAQALDLLRQTDFDVVLMDLHMPVMDGLEALRLIRQLPGRRGQVPVVALSADVLTDTQDRAHEAGVNAYLGKPFLPQRLQEVMAQCVVQRAVTS